MSVEGHGRSRRGSGSSVGGQGGGVIGDHLEVRCSLLTLPKAMGISRSEILRKKKKADQKLKSCPRFHQLTCVKLQTEVASALDVSIPGTR